MEQAEVIFLLIRLNRAICWGVGNLVGRGLQKNPILMVFLGLTKGPREFALLFWPMGDMPGLPGAGAVPIWCGTCSLPAGDKHIRLPAEGPPVGRVGLFLDSALQRTGPCLS